MQDLLCYPPAEQIVESILSALDVDVVTGLTVPTA
jgi:hypothetical protein